MCAAAQKKASRRRRPSMVAARGVLRDLSAQLCRQQQRRHRRPERHHLEAGLPERISASTPSGSRPASLAASGFRLRRFRLRKHRSHVRHARGLRSAWQRKRKKHGIRIILDFVMNHTSDQHKWFIDSKSSQNFASIATGTSGATAKGRNQPPNNWISTFGGSAWKFDPATNQYYYHYFYPEQPDLNWRNPAVEERDVRRDALVVQARRRRLPPGCGGYAVRRSRPARQSGSAGQERIRRSEHERQIQRQAARRCTTCCTICAKWPTNTTPC